jgi:[protein-PII] uridylyltransferase
VNNLNHQFSESLFNAENAPEQFKKLIKFNNEELARQFDPHQPVNPLILAKAKFIDKLLLTCWKHFFADLENELSLIAVGGYGRSELFPHSDIDILVLLGDKQDLQFHSALSNFNAFLWDIGLQPGLSTRTVDECVDAAIDDQTVLTGLLEMRRVCGNTALFKTLKKRMTSEQIWPSEPYFSAKLEEQIQRHTKYHDTAYNLEPNVKESPGGLRDMQVIAWVFKHHYHAATLRELIKYEFITPQEYEKLISAQQKLWQIRYALHILTGRCEDRLLFDNQRELANWFGYVDENNNQCIEQFMQNYYRTVVGLERLNEMLLQIFKERFITQTEPKTVQDIDANFDSISGYIEAKHENVFVDNPLALLEIFLLQQRNPLLKGIRATTIRLIRRNIHLIDENFRQNQQAHEIFIEIFRQPRGLTHALRRMNRYGVLPAYLPCFANIVARMQYDLFHIYTVDEHTLFVIRNLRRFSLEEHKQELPFCNAIFLRINKPEILYIAALFHDIAKGKGGDHSVLGEEIAKDFCNQHELSSHDTKLISWLVKNHLLMSMTAQRKDISDPEIIHEFATILGNTEYLNHLYLLTVADIRATSPKLWNSWKDSLLKELYNAAHTALRKGLQEPASQQVQISETKQEARKELHEQGISDQTIDQTWMHFNDDYFLRYYPEEIVCHTTAIASSNEEDLPLVLLRPQTLRGNAEVFIFTQAKKGVFSNCTATLDQLGLTILDARIVTTKDQYTLNSFQVLEQSGEPITDLPRELHICSSIRKSILNDRVSNQVNLHRQSQQAKHFPIPTRIYFHEDIHNECTILEIITTDQPGLLSKISKAFLEHDIYINSARITTIGSRVEDIFYISDQDSRPISNQVKLDNIKDSLLADLEKQ